MVILDAGHDMVKHGVSELQWKHGVLEPQWWPDAVPGRDIPRLLRYVQQGGTCGEGDQFDLICVLISACNQAYADDLNLFPLSRELRDERLPLVAELHGKALTALSPELAPEQIDEGMFALAASVSLAAETGKQKAARSADALRDIKLRLKLFRNLLENITLAEALASNLRKDKRNDAVARHLGRHMSAAA